MCSRERVTQLLKSYTIGAHTQATFMQTAPLSRIAVLIPVLNAHRDWELLQGGLLKQSLDPSQVTIIDSSSTDDTAELARAAGYNLVVIPRSEFNHGGTRQWAAEQMKNVEILVYLTQDTVLTNDDSLLRLIAPFDDPEMGATFGRQLPKSGAGPLEAHARVFNYPDRSMLRTYASREQLGFKAIFSSNSFSAYRISALQDVGGFPADVIVSEETVVFARMLKKGWKTAYVAEAVSYHSHGYSWRQELQRYFDIGVLHTDQNWLLETYGHVGGEGFRFVRSEWKFLWPRHWYLLPASLIRITLKLIGYRLGRNYQKLSRSAALSLSQQKNFWVQR